MEPKSISETREHLFMYYIGDESANGSKLAEMRKKNSELNNNKEKNAMVIDSEGNKGKVANEENAENIQNSKGKKGKSNLEKSDHEDTSKAAHSNEEIQKVIFQKTLTYHNLHSFHHLSIYGFLSSKTFPFISMPTGSILS